MSLELASTASRLLLNQSLFCEKTSQVTTNSNKITRKRSNLARTTAMKNTTTRYSYRTCPICSQRLLVRINGSFVYKWISTHFSTHHHEWMHVVVNLHEP
ncbi:hypothetical protein CU098_006782 [Rhizopus stolonifer]|uniref:Uncharacterized protein n=1 Tax=Rhizopus stolonifer TaxID=4846 RepID=A0A367J1B3_RHIST|nr:hypothetical protein CU098_006782 [Rhizopus stolonifer]